MLVIFQVPVFVFVFLLRAFRRIDSELKNIINLHFSVTRFSPSAAALFTLVIFFTYLHNCSSTTHLENIFFRPKKIYYFFGLKNDRRHIGVLAQPSAEWSASWRFTVIREPITARSTAKGPRSGPAGAEILRSKNSQAEKHSFPHFPLRKRPKSRFHVPSRQVLQLEGAAADGGKTCTN